MFIYGEVFRLYIYPFIGSQKELSFISLSHEFELKMSHQLKIKT